ncbi:MAG: homoserine kinase [Anaerolineae bacterium]|nr:homoserine kinase [Anaerolineae bacterium]NUQ04343.1 homoserine kinase [Anaerolineae bacterium]
MPFSTAEAFAPATVANLGVGFDILGLALDEPGDIVIAERTESAGVTLANIEGDGGRLPRTPSKNTACVAAQSVLRAVGVKHGARLTIKKGLPSASGLGSSAASAVAAAVAVNALLENPLPKADLLPACLDGEAIASGYHPDNVAPCLFGGITLAFGIRAHQIVSLPIPNSLYLVLVTPDVEVPTAQARAVLPATVPLRQMVKQTAMVARLIDAIYRGDIPAMSAAMEGDEVIEAARAHLMPMLAEARAAAKASGAQGLVISGAGPTLCAVCDHPEAAEDVTEALRLVYAEAHIECMARWTQVAADGARVIRAQ